MCIASKTTTTPTMTTTSTITTTIKAATLASSILTEIMIKVAPSPLSRFDGSATQALDRPKKRQRIESGMGTTTAEELRQSWDGSSISWCSSSSSSSSSSPPSRSSPLNDLDRVYLSISATRNNDVSAGEEAFPTIGFDIFDDENDDNEEQSGCNSSLLNDNHNRFVRKVRQPKQRGMKRSKSFKEDLSSLSLCESEKDRHAEIEARGLAVERNRSSASLLSSKQIQKVAVLPSHHVGCNMATTTTSQQQQRLTTTQFSSKYCSTR